MVSKTFNSTRNDPGRLRTWRSGCFRALAGTAAAILIAAAFSLPSVHALQIAAVKHDKIVYLHQISPGDEFSTGYVHSVELSPVQEYYCIDKDYRMVLKATTFRSSNVGLPYAAFGEEVFHMTPEGFRISNMDRVVPQLLIWADRRYDNRLQFNGADMALYGFEGITLVRINIEILSLSRFALTKAAIWMACHTNWQGGLWQFPAETQEHRDCGSLRLSVSMGKSMR